MRKAENTGPTPSKYRPFSAGWRLAALVIAALLLAFPASTMADDWDIDLRIGSYTDISKAFAGAGLLTRVGNGEWFFNPNFEYVFVNRGDLVTINADFHNDLASRGQTDFWLGAGAALVFRDNDRGNSNTDVGLNLLGGASFLRSNEIRPFLQAKLLLSDDTEGVIAFGIRF